MTAAGLTPYSVEAMSCFIAGTRCEQTFLRKTEEEGFPETMCSYHRVFLGAALSGLVPKPKCMIYTNLACDSNMMTFPYLKQKNMLPGFFIDVPYDKNEDSVKSVSYTHLDSLLPEKCTRRWRYYNQVEVYQNCRSLNHPENRNCRMMKAGCWEDGFQQKMVRRMRCV